MSASVKQITNEAATKIVRRKGRNNGFGSSLAQDLEHCWICQPADRDSATLVDAAKDRSATTATNSNPVSQSISRAIGRIRQPILSPFGPTNRQFPCLGIIIRKIDRNRFRPPQSSAVEQCDNAASRAPAGELSRLHELISAVISQYARPRPRGSV